MTIKTLAATTAIALSLATPALADNYLGVPPPEATPVQEWFHSATAIVNEALVNTDRHRQCTLNLMNGPAAFGVLTNGSMLQVSLYIYNATGNFSSGYIRLQVDNYTPWRITGDADPSVQGMFISDLMGNSGSKQFIPQLIAGQTLRVEVSTGVHTFSLASSAPAFQALVACEHSITHQQAPAVRPTAPATRDLTL